MKLKLELWSGINNDRGWFDTQVADSWWIGLGDYHLVLCFQPLNKWHGEFFLHKSIMRDGYWLAFGSGHATWGKTRK